MALCYREMADGENDEMKKKDQMLKVGQLYQQSTNFYFDDDEQYSCEWSSFSFRKVTSSKCVFNAVFLALSLEAYWNAQVGLDITLPIMKSLKVSAPKMKKIWEHSTLARGKVRDVSIGHCLDVYEKVLDKISRGELKEDSPYVPVEDIR